MSITIIHLIELADMSASSKLQTFCTRITTCFSPYFGVMLTTVVAVICLIYFRKSLVFLPSLLLSLLFHAKINIVCAFTGPIFVHQILNRLPGVIEFIQIVGKHWFFPVIVQKGISTANAIVLFQ